MVTGFSDGIAAGAKALLFEFYNGDAVFSLTIDAGAEAAHTGVPLEVLLNRRPQSTGKNRAFTLCSCALPCIGKRRLRYLQCKTFA